MLPLLQYFPFGLEDLKLARLQVVSATAAAAASEAIALRAQEDAQAELQQQVAAARAAAEAASAYALAACGERKRAKKNMTPLQRWKWMIAEYDWIDVSEARREEWLVSRTVWCLNCREAKNGSKNFCNIARHEFTEKHRSKMGGGREMGGRGGHRRG
jgi:hypothetical protein